jgi:hypothetical protein
MIWLAQFRQVIPTRGVDIRPVPRLKLSAVKSRELIRVTYGS